MCRAVGLARGRRAALSVLRAVVGLAHGHIRSIQVVPILFLGKPAKSTGRIPGLDLRCQTSSCADSMSWCCPNTKTAARRGHLECLKRLHAAGQVWKRSDMRLLAEGGHAECLKFAHRKGCPWHPEVTLWLAKRSDSKLLRYVVQRGCPWHSETQNAAARSGDIRLQWLPMA